VAFGLPAKPATRARASTDASPGAYLDDRSQGAQGTLIPLDLPFQGGDVETGKLMRTILLALGTWNLERTTRLILQGKMRGVRAGKKTSVPPFGYLKAADGTLEPDPKTAPVVREAFRLAAAEGVHAAARHLTEALGRAHNTQRTRRLLANRAYLGEMRFGDNVVQRVKRGDGRWVRRVVSWTEVEGAEPPVVVHGAHEALVPRSLFDRAQHEPSGQRAPSPAVPAVSPLLLKNSLPRLVPVFRMMSKPSHCARTSVPDSVKLNLWGGLALAGPAKPNTAQPTITGRTSRRTFMASLLRLRACGQSPTRRKPGQGCTTTSPTPGMKLRPRPQPDVRRRT